MIDILCIITTNIIFSLGVTIFNVISKDMDIINKWYM